MSDVPVFGDQKWIEDAYPRLGKVRKKAGAAWADVVGFASNGKTCKDCAFVRQQTYTKAVYYKCSAHSMSRGESTDIRLKHPACVMFKVRSD